MEPRSPLPLFQIVWIVLVKFGFHLKRTRTVSVGVHFAATYPFIREQVVHKTDEPLHAIQNVIEQRDKEQPPRTDMERQQYGRDSRYLHALEELFLMCTLMAFCLSGYLFQNG